MSWFVPEVIALSSVCAVAAIAGAWPASALAVPAGQDITCRPSGAIVQAGDLPEGSGVAAGRRTPGILWAHNDGEPVLIPLDQRGKVAGRINLTGPKLEDWEAIASGPCAPGTCLYLGDIGDNDGERSRVTIYRIPEPEPSADSITLKEAFHATYPDGPHDAEALLVTPRGEIFIVTKGENGSVGLYRLPENAKAGATSQLQRVEGSTRNGGDREDRITDGSVSPDGRTVVLRTNSDLRFYAAADFFAGKWRETGRVDLRPLGEPQGEGVTFANDTTIVLVGEGGEKSRPGTFARLTCGTRNADSRR